MRDMYTRKEQKKVIFRLPEEIKEELYQVLYAQNITTQEFFENFTMDYLESIRSGK